MYDGTDLLCEGLKEEISYRDLSTYKNNLILQSLLFPKVCFLKCPLTIAQHLYFDCLLFLHNRGAGPLFFIPFVSMVVKSGKMVT